MSGWHVPERALRDWAQSQVDPTVASSLEQHLLNCAQCRESVAATQRDGTVDGAVDLDRVWLAIADEVEPPRSPWWARALQRAGMDDVDVRLLTAARSLTAAWFAAVGLVLLFTIVASGVAPDRTLALYLMVAPLVPLAGVAAAYGEDVDPTFELTVAAPYSKLRLLLLRTGAVAVASVPATTLAGLWQSGPWWVCVVWLLPAVAFILVTLALSIYVPLRYAAAAVVVGWSAISLQAVVRENPASLTNPAILVALGGLAAVAVAVLIPRLRRLSVDWGIG